MKSFRINSLLLILFFAYSQFFLFACAGLKDVPESEHRYVEGVVVEGGVFGVRIKDENEKVLRFITRKGVDYQPDDFHAYVGDKVGVTYYSEMKRGAERHMALAIKVLETDPNRPDLGHGAVDGIVRATGMMRNLVHLPKSGLTVAFYPKGTVQYAPSHWSPKVGSPVKVFYTEDAKRFYRKFLYYRMERLGSDRVSIQDKAAAGVVTDILTQRDIHQRPDRFAFQTNNGQRVNLYVGGETKLVPMDLRIEPGGAYNVVYYPLLMGDQSLRHVVTHISR